MIKQQRRGPLGWHPHKTGSNPSFFSHAFFSPFSSFNSICYFGVPFYSWLLDLCLLVFSSLKGKSAKKNSLLLHYRLLSTYCLCHASTFCTSPLSLHPPPAPPLQEKHYYFLLVSEGTGAQRGWMKSWSSQSSEGATLDFSSVFTTSGSPFILINEWGRLHFKRPPSHIGEICFLSWILVF